MLKKMTIGKKIFTGFSIILLLLVIVGSVSFRALTGSSDGFEHYREMARDTNLTGRLQANMLMVRMNVKDFLITGKEKDVEEFYSYWEKTESFMAQAQNEINNPERASMIDLADNRLKAYHKAFKEVIDLRNRQDYILQKVLNIKGPVMEDSLSKIMVSAERDNDMAAAFHSGIALKHLLLARFYMAGFLNSNDISIAEKVYGEFAKMEKALIVLNREIQNSKRRELLATITDERKLYLKTFGDLKQAVITKNKIVKERLDVIGPEVAKDIESVKLDIKKTQDELGPRLIASNTRSNKMILGIGVFALLFGVVLAIFISRGLIASIKTIATGLNEGAEQVAVASEQVSSASQELAEGASEQAAAIEETSSSIEEMASMTKHNAENAAHADNLMSSVSKVVMEANDSMSELVKSMGEISESSEQTSRIIKTIDEIAFQTNLLALNAAVEAARAGEAGAGFAVVADEVRNLAMRAAEAAKSTAELIEATVRKISDGTELVSKTNGAFIQVAENSEKIGTLVGEISSASAEQAEGVNQINRAVADMDRIIQKNAANAEETAGASEEMNAQSDQLKEMVDELVALVETDKNHQGTIRSGRERTKSDMKSVHSTKNQNHIPMASGHSVTPEAILPLNEDFTDF